MNYTILAPLNAVLNLISFVLLIAGYIAIKRGDKATHKRRMISALIVSGLFLISYLIYHNNVGSVPYPLYDWTRTLYFIILIPHIILAALITPFILILVVWALRGKFDKHQRLARKVFPVWLFVSISGVLVYVMLYVYAGGSSN